MPGHGSARRWGKCRCKLKLSALLMSLHIGGRGKKGGGFATVSSSYKVRGMRALGFTASRHDTNSLILCLRDARRGAAPCREHGATPLYQGHLTGCGLSPALSLRCTHMIQGVAHSTSRALCMPVNDLDDRFCFFRSQSNIRRMVGLRPPPPLLF